MTERETVEEFESTAKNTWQWVEGTQGGDNKMRTGDKLRIDDIIIEIAWRNFDMREGNHQQSEKDNLLDGRTYSPMIHLIKD